MARLSYLLDTYPRRIHTYVLYVSFFNKMVSCFQNVGQIACRLSATKTSSTVILVAAINASASANRRDLQRRRETIKLALLFHQSADSGPRLADPDLIFLYCFHSIHQTDIKHIKYKLSNHYPKLGLGSRYHLYRLLSKRGNIIFRNNKRKSQN